MSGLTRTRSERIEAIAQMLETEVEMYEAVTRSGLYRIAEAVYENFEKIEAIIDGTPEDFYPFLRDSGLVE